jgi:GTP-binding protein
LDLVLATVPGPEIDEHAPLQMLVTNLDWSDYVGRIAIGRIYSGTLRRGQAVLLAQAGGTFTQAKVAAVNVFDRLGRSEVEEATAGDIAAVIGLEMVAIGDTISEPESPRVLPRVEVDEPTLQMTFGINTSPLSGREGRFLTTRHLRDRLAKEVEKNVALRVEFAEGADSFQVSGRGLLHLSVLIEIMRREGFELAIGKPRVILHQRNGVTEEPFESLVVEVPPERMGPVMELVGGRRGQVVEMQTHGSYTYLVFSIPARGLIGLRTRLLNSTQGTAIMHHRFEGYRPWEGDIPGRPNGVLVSMAGGRAVAFGLDSLQERAEMFIAPGEDVYEGMIVGENSRLGDMVVNPTKEKKLTNIRAAGRDENILLKPPRVMTLEAALEYIEDDELVEVTPAKIRLRKTVLSATDRKRQARRREQEYQK